MTNTKGEFKFIKNLIYPLGCYLFILLVLMKAPLHALGVEVNGKPFPDKEYSVPGQGTNYFDPDKIIYLANDQFLTEYNFTKLFMDHAASPDLVYQASFACRPVTSITIKKEESDLSQKIDTFIRKAKETTALLNGNILVFSSSTEDATYFPVHDNVESATFKAYQQAVQISSTPVFSEGIPQRPFMLNKINRYLLEHGTITESAYEKIFRSKEKAPKN